MMNKKEVSTEHIVEEKSVTAPLMEVSLVFGLMLFVKWLLDHFQVIGAGSIAMWLSILLVTALMRRRGVTWRDKGLSLPQGKREWLTHLGFGFLTVVLIFLVMGLILEPLYSQLGLEKPDDVADRFIFFLNKPFVFLSYLLLVALLGAALGEELLIRGYLLNQLIDSFGVSKMGYFGALLIQAMVFGVLHSYQGLSGMITTAVVAFIFGSVYLAVKKKLFPVVFAHAFINTLTMTAFYLSGGNV